APANNSATSPTTGLHTPGAPTRPESYQQAQAQARHIIGTDPNYTLVYAELEIRLGQTSHCDWAVSPKGSCLGKFRDGTRPFNERVGYSQWEQFGAGGGPPDIPAVRDGGIKITQISQARIECYIRNRVSNDCYTTASQEGKPVGEEGGPLHLNASFPARESGYGDILVNGFCQM